MCRKEPKSPPMPMLPMDSMDDLGWTTSSSDDDGPHHIRQRAVQLVEDSKDGACSSVLLHTLGSIVAGAITASAVTAFALWFPFKLAPIAASKTYHWAFYRYDSSISHFDNTVWTYGTDYGLAVLMALLAFVLIRFSRSNVTDRLCLRGAALLGCYCLSVLAGGYCHHQYLTIEERNSASFQFLWTLCVGSVTLASTFMGMAGTECVRKFQNSKECPPLLNKMPLVPDAFWWSFGAVNTAIVAAGGMSFQRPACDIFIAGITQSPSTFYVMIFLTLVRHSSVNDIKAKVVGNIGFILNAPLLPMYPLLVQYTDWSLGYVNAILHSCLCLAWSTQGTTLLHMIRALLLEQQLVDTKRQ